MRHYSKFFGLLAAIWVITAGLFYWQEYRTGWLSKNSVTTPLVYAEPLVFPIPNFIFLNQRCRLPKQLKKDTVTLMAVGDIMLSRVVGQKMVEYQDYNYPFLKTADILKKADLTFGNLETAITPGKPVLTSEMHFRADPEAVAGLVYAGFDVMSLANNHTLNFGQSGLKDTFKYLSESDIDYVGAGENLEKARQPIIKKVNDISIAFWAFSDSQWPGFSAGTDYGGVAVMDIDFLRQDIKRIGDGVDVKIVSMHAGTEYETTPNNRQIEFARRAIDAGADLIIGHHPHVVQTVEQYHNGWIIYSLGNFVFDQMWSEATREGLIAKIILNKQGVKDIEFIPVIIEDYSQPRLVTDS